MCRNGLSATSITHDQVLHLNVFVVCPSGIVLERKVCHRVLLDALHEVLIRRPVYASDGLHHQVHDGQGSQRNKASGPPAQLTAKVIEECPPDEILARLVLICSGQNNLPQEPAADGNDEAAKRNDCFAVQFEDPAGIVSASILRGRDGTGSKGKTYNSFTLMKMTATVKQTAPIAYRLVSWVKRATAYDRYMK